MKQKKMQKERLGMLGEMKQQQGDFTGNREKKQ